MEIKLKKAWLVDGSKITSGFAFEPETLNDGVITRDSEKFFTSDGKNFTRSNWDVKILFDERRAKMCAEDNKKNKIKYAKEQIEYYSKQLTTP